MPDRASDEAISHFYTSTHGPRRIAFFRDFATTAGGRPRRLTARPGAGATSRVRRARAAVEMSHPAPTRRAPGRAKRDFRAIGENIATLRPSYGIARAAPPPAELPALPPGCVEHGPTSGRPILHQHGEHGRPQNELFRPVEVR